MRSFEGNLSAYHALNGINDLKVAEFSRRLHATTTKEEMLKISEESQQYFNEQGKFYKELGEEMVKIMSKHWWEFWK